MNFLDAHKIVHELAYIVGQGSEFKDDFFISTDKLSFRFDKDKIVSAFQIFIYHMIFFQTRTAEEYNKYYVLYQMNIDRFLPEAEIQKIRQYNRILNNKNPIYKAINKEKIRMATELYSKFMEKNLSWLNPYRIDDIFGDNLGEMKAYRQELLKTLNGKSDTELYDAYDYVIELYAIKTYEKAYIAWKDEYFYYFQDFETMRNALKKPEYNKYYQKYKEYILSNS